MAGYAPAALQLKERMVECCQFSKNGGSACYAQYNKHFYTRETISFEKLNDLRLLEDDLVLVYVTNSGEKIVDGRELHTVLQSKQDFSTWVKKRLNECDAVENRDYVLNHNFVEQVSGTKHRIDCTILLDTAKEMVMLERNEVGKNVRKYFIRTTNKLTNVKWRYSRLNSSTIFAIWRFPHE